MPVLSSQKKLKRNEVIAQIQLAQGRKPDEKPVVKAASPGALDTVELVRAGRESAASGSISAAVSVEAPKNEGRDQNVVPLTCPPLVDVDLTSRPQSPSELAADDTRSRLLPTAEIALNELVKESRLEGAALRQMLIKRLCEPAKPALYINEIEGICAPIEKIVDTELQRAVIEQTEAVRTASMRGDLKDIVNAFVALETASDVSLVGQVMKDICQGAERAHLVAGDIADMIACVAKLGADSQRLAIALTAHQGKHTVHLRRRILWLKGAAELHRDVRLDLMRLVQPKMCEEGEQRWKAEDMVALGRVIERLNATKEVVLARGQGSRRNPVTVAPLLNVAAQRHLLFLWNDLDDQTGGERSVEELSRFMECVAELPSSLWESAQQAALSIVASPSGSQSRSVRNARFDVLEKLQYFPSADWPRLNKRLSAFRVSDRNTVELVALLAEAAQSNDLETLELARPLGDTMANLNRYFTALKLIDPEARQTVAETELAIHRASGPEDRLERLQQVWLNSLLRDRDFVQVERN